MSEEPQEQPNGRTRFSEHRLVILVSGSIAVSFVLVVISMLMYMNSPARKLDASRPGLKSVQDKIEKFDNFKEFSASGPINKDTLEEFEKLYSKQVRDALGYNAFSSEALSDQTLHIDSSEQAEPAQ